MDGYHWGEHWEGLIKIWKDKDVTIETKRRLVIALEFPVTMYRCESWTVKINKGRRLIVLKSGVGDE